MRSYGLHVGYPARKRDEAGRKKTTGAPVTRRGDDPQALLSRGYAHSSQFCQVTVAQRTNCAYFVSMLTPRSPKITCPTCQHTYSAYATHGEYFCDVMALLNARQLARELQAGHELKAAQAAKENALDDELSDVLRDYGAGDIGLHSAREDIKRLFAREAA